MEGSALNQLSGKFRTKREGDNKSRS